MTQRKQPRPQPKSRQRNGYVLVPDDIVHSILLRLPVKSLMRDSGAFVNPGTHPSPAPILSLPILITVTTKIMVIWYTWLLFSESPQTVQLFVTALIVGFPSIQYPSLFIHAMQK